MAGRQKKKKFTADFYQVISRISIFGANNFQFKSNGVDTNLFSNSISTTIDEFQGKLIKEKKAPIKISILSAYRTT